MSRRGIILLAVLAALAAIPASGKCFRDVRVTHPDGSVETCEWYCVVSGGVITSGCTGS